MRPSSSEGKTSLKDKYDNRRRLLCEAEAAEGPYDQYTGSRISSAGSAAWIFMILFYIDCCLTGAGRLISFGFFSLRMVIFAAAFILSLPLVIKNAKRLVRDPFVYITLIFGAVIVIWAVYGYFNGNPLVNIQEDATACLTIALVPGMLCVVDSQKKVLQLVDAVFYASFLLAAVSLLFQFALPHIDRAAFNDINTYLNAYQIGGFSRLESGSYRIYFRSQIFAQVAVVLGIWKVWHADSVRKKLVFIAFEGVIVYSWFISYTRGFWIGLGASVLFVLVWQPRVFGKCFKVGLCALLASAVIMGFSWINEGAPNVPSELYNRVVITVEQNIDVGSEPVGAQSTADIASQNIRMLTKEMQKEYIRQYPVFGRGLGAYLVGLRVESSVEYTYLDVLMKLGIVGTISFAAAFFVFLRKAFIHRVFRPKQDAENSFYTLTTLVMAAYIGVAVTSITNPFLISPLGIAPLMAAEAAVHNCRINDKKVV